MELKYQDGLIPAVIQDASTGKVLMLGYMNGEAYERTLKTGQVTFTVEAAESSGQRAKPPATSLSCARCA